MQAFTPRIRNTTHACACMQACRWLTWCCLGSLRNALLQPIQNLPVLSRNHLELEVCILDVGHLRANAERYVGGYGGRLTWRTLRLALRLTNADSIWPVATTVKELGGSISFGALSCRRFSEFEMGPRLLNFNDYAESAYAFAQDRRFPVQSIDGSVSHAKRVHT